MYSRLCDSYYAREAPIPLDIAAACRLVRAQSPAARKAVQTVLPEFFIKMDDGWHQKRCDEEIAKYREKAAKASRSASVRWCERNANASDSPTPGAMRTHMRTHSEGNANQEPITNNQEPLNTKTARKRATPSTKTTLPEDVGISERVRQWALDRGHLRLAERFEHFVGYVRRSGKRYADWDEALMSAIREDWAKLDGSAGDELQERKLRAARNMDVLTGKVGNGRERIIAAERMDSPVVLTLPGRIRESDADNVEGCRPAGSASVVGG